MLSKGKVRRVEAVEWVIWTLALVAFALAFLVALPAHAQDVPAGSRSVFPNGDVLLTAGITPDGVPDVPNTVQACWRVEGGAELGCVSTAANCSSSETTPNCVAVANDAFVAESTLIFLGIKSPAGPTVRVAFLRVPRPAPGAFRVRARTVSAAGVVNERGDAIVFLAPPPPAPTPTPTPTPVPQPAQPQLLELLQSLESLLNLARERLAQLDMPGGAN